MLCLCFLFKLGVCQTWGFDRLYCVIFVGGRTFQKGAFPPLPCFPISLNDDHGTEHHLRISITEVEYHRGGFICCVWVPPHPEPLTPSSPPPPPTPLTLRAVPQSSWGAGGGLPRGWPETLSSCSPCFNVSQDETFLFFSLSAGPCFMCRRMTIKFCGGVRGGGQWGGEGPLCPRKCGLCLV